jgi:hypothetical protein
MALTFKPDPHQLRGRTRSAIAGPLRLRSQTRTMDLKVQVEKPMTTHRTKASYVIAAADQAHVPSRRQQRKVTSP